MMQEKWPRISVVIPVRNEQPHIAACLQSILDGSYPHECLEIWVVDGSSDDGTREIIQDFSRRYPLIGLLENPARVTPHAMNAGIRAARGELVVRIDAHAHYGPDYLTTLAAWMERLGADNVGGVVVTQPASDSSQAKAVAVILSHPFGIGNSQFRLDRGGEPFEVDTVPFGCYRREIFDRIGMYDELFVRNQDDELNARLKKAGGRIFLIPDVRIDYVARDSLNKLARMFYQYGYFKPLVAIKLGRPATWRQLVPPAFTAALLGLPLISWLVPGAGWLWTFTVGAHSTVNLLVSARQARDKGWRLFPYLFYGFLMAHVAYGLGYLHGGLNFGVLRRHLTRSESDISLSR